MKKTLLMFMLASMLAFSARGQVLQNTWWIARDTSSNNDGWFNFAQDTLWVSMDGINYDSTSLYTESGINLTIVDIAAGLCPFSDSGKYYFSVNADTLQFLYITDSCNSRLMFFSWHWFVRYYTGISDINPFSTTTVYPNPSADGIFNLSFSGNNNMPERIYVRSADGRKIMEETFSSSATNHTLNLQPYASGIYFLLMENEKGRRVVKLVR